MVSSLDFGIQEVGVPAIPLPLDYITLVKCLISGSLSFLLCKMEIKVTTV